MFKNYLTVAVRNLFRHKAYTAINIFGLAVGMASCVLIVLWVQDELSWDRFHPHAGDIYRITRADHVSTPGGLGLLIQADFPEVIGMTRYYPRPRLITSGDRKFTLRLANVDSSFLSVFPFPVVKGDAGSALDSRGSIVITARIAPIPFVSSRLRSSGNSVTPGSDTNLSGCREMKRMSSCRVIAQNPSISGTLKYSTGDSARSCVHSSCGGPLSP